jgi:hypothetical protein
LAAAWVRRRKRCVRNGSVSHDGLKRRRARKRTHTGRTYPAPLLKNQ